MVLEETLYLILERKPLQKGLKHISSKSRGVNDRIRQIRKKQAITAAATARRYVIFLTRGVSFFPFQVESYFKYHNA